MIIDIEKKANIPKMFGNIGQKIFKIINQDQISKKNTNTKCLK